MEMRTLSHALLLVCLSIASIFRASEGALDAAFLARANETYAKAIPCLKSAWMMSGRDTNDWKFPDDAEAHYQDLLEKTARFRTAHVHSYAAYDGPWIENIFISTYMDKPLTYFQGFIPLFLQWIDTQISGNRHFEAIHNELNKLLRPNVLYLAVSQGDVGLGKIGAAHPNLMALAAGGFGHVVIPLIRGEIPWVPEPTEYEQTVGFFGNANQHQSNRPKILAQVRDAVAALNITYKQGYGNTWMKDMEATKYNLAPRGYGRSSFRFSESIQMGRIPVFLYDDHPWIPYMGSNLSIEHFGFMAGMDSIEHSVHSTFTAIQSTTPEQHAVKMKALQDARYHYTYEGVLHQLDLFLNDPFGPKGGALTCTTHPRTERCCGRRRNRRKI